jgi:hypothetical protein
MLILKWSLIQRITKPHKMSRQISIKFSLLILLFFISPACKKKENAGDNEKPVLPTQPFVPEIPKSEVKVYIPLVLQTDNEKIELKYADDGLQLTEIKYASGKREVITYNDKKPKEYRRYDKDEMVYMIDYILNGEGLVTRGNKYQVESGGKVLTPLGNFQISYNEQRLVSAINSYDFRNNLVSNHQYNYDENHLLSSITSDDLKPVAIKYTYDGKQGLLKNVTSTQMFAIESEDFFLHNIKSNLTAVVNEGNADKNLNLSCEYNKDGYPSTFTLTKDNKKTIYKITYR